MISGQDTSAPPANEAIVASGIGAKAAGRIAPWHARSQDPEDAVEDTTMIYPWHATHVTRATDTSIRGRRGSHLSWRAIKRQDRWPVGGGVNHDSRPFSRTHLPRPRDGADF